MYGGHVTSWKNDQGEELLFVSNKVLCRKLMYFCLFLCFCYCMMMGSIYNVDYLFILLPNNCLLLLLIFPLSKYIILYTWFGT